MEIPFFKKKDISKNCKNVSRVLWRSLDCLSSDLCELIIKYLIWPTIKNHHTFDQYAEEKHKIEEIHWICEWDFYEKISSGYVGRLQNFKRFKHLTRKQTPRQIYFYSRISATDCEESEELSVHELENEQDCILRKQTRFRNYSDESGNKVTSSTETISKMELFHRIQLANFAERFQEHFFFHLFQHAPLEGCYAYHDDLDSGDEADDEQ